jgi:hypothetical protein
MPALMLRTSKPLAVPAPTVRTRTVGAPTAGAPTLRTNTLRADMAADLSRLETQAAVLERDARNSRAILVERGLDLAPERPPYFAWEAARSRWMRKAAKTWRVSVEWADWAVRTSTPYIATGFRLAKRGVVEAAVSLTFAGATLAAFTLAILVIAPPD